MAESATPKRTRRVFSALDPHNRVARTARTTRRTGGVRGKKPLPGAVALTRNGRRFVKGGDKKAERAVRTKRSVPPPPPRRYTTTPASAARKRTEPLPPVEEGVIRVIPLGGVEEIGRNMTAVEIGDDIMVIDCGFQFSEVETPGVDYILPNTKYLEDNRDRVRALFITHGHLDHIGGIPFVIDRIGMPPIYTRNLTAIMIKKRQTEFPHLPPLDLRVVEKNETITVGSQKVSFFAVTHTIPESMGIYIHTPHGGITVPSDFKLDHIDGIPTPQEEENYKFFDDHKTLLLMLDSTNVENPGWSTPERIVLQNLEQFIRESTSRLIIGTFASQMERMIHIIEAAERYGKKIIYEGRSMKANIEIAKHAGMLKVKESVFIQAQDADKYPDEKIVVLATGAQGEEFAALMRMANKTHRSFHIKKGDTVLLSASIVPGNERAVAKLKDEIARQGARIISYRTSDIYVHSTGHGNREELKWLHLKVKPKFFVPIHGSHYNLRLHEQLALEVGMRESNIVVPDNGTVIEIRDKGRRIVRRKEKAPSTIRMVDGLTIGDVQEVVIRDRQTLAEDGMFVVIALLNTKTGKLKKSPDIISRGFVYLRESQDLLQETRVIAKKTIEDITKSIRPIDFDYIRKQMSEAISAYLLQKTHKRPIVIPVLIGV